MSERPDPYRGVVALLAGAATVGAASAVAAGLALPFPSLISAAALGVLAAGMLLGTALAQAVRGGSLLARRLSPRLLRIAVAVTGGYVALNGTGSLPDVPTPTILGFAAGFAAAGLVGSLIAVRYLADLDRQALPEAVGLAEWGRACGWAFAGSLVADALLAAGLNGAAEAVGVGLVLAAVVLAVDVGFSRDPEEVEWRSGTRLLDLLASRLDPVGSLFDGLDRSFGIDLRSTWALAVVRRAVEPLVVGVAAVGWLSTAFTVVLPDEQGLVERFGVATGGPRDPGLLVHFPWPIDQVTRVRVRQARTTPIGHEGTQAAGPEDVLWARQHATNEYTLVLGDGRDLVTVDAAVHYRIVDPVAWRYGSQNPEDALRAMAYRAVMDRTVDRTLADVLSENVAKTTDQLTRDVQQGADALGLGVQVLGFTVGGMHPPVPVAKDYQAVVSAEISRQTAEIEARAYANTVVPGAESQVVVKTDAAEADGARARQTAAGESIGFRTLEEAYKADPEEFRFRRRLEVLEQVLPGRRFTVLDQRIERDGGELWLTE